MKISIVLLSLFVTCAANRRIRRSRKTLFDRRTGLPDTIRDTYSCISCNYFFEKVDGAEKFFTSSDDLETRKAFSMERMKLVESLSLQGDCSKIEGLPERHIGKCQHIARRFFQDAAKVALCVSTSQDSGSPGRATYCGCAAGDGMPTRGKARTCPPNSELVDMESETAPLTPSAASRESNVASSATSSGGSGGSTSGSTSVSSSGASSGTSRDERKCGFCLEFMDGDLNLSDKIFYRGRPKTTRERVAFNKDRNSVLEGLHPRTQCRSSGLDPECVSVVNFLRETSYVGLCLGNIRPSEDSHEFCGCVAKSGTPSRTPFVCPK